MEYIVKVTKTNCATAFKDKYDAVTYMIDLVKQGIAFSFYVEQLIHQPGRQTAQFLGVKNMNKIKAKCLKKANEWHRHSLAMDSVDLYDRYVAYNQWTSELSEDDLVTFYLLVAHSEFDK